MMMIEGKVAPLDYSRVWQDGSVDEAEPALMQVPAGVSKESDLRGGAHDFDDLRSMYMFTSLMAKANAGQILGRT
jgi:hypothetical protein